MMRSRFLVLMAALLLALMGMASAKTTIQFWNGHTGPDGVVMNQLVKDFEASHPDIQIEVQAIPWAQLFTKIQIAKSGGGAPDLITMPVSDLITYKDTLVNPIGQIASEFSKSDFAAADWDRTIMNGKQYGLPLDMHPYVLYYRKDLVQKAGLDPLPTDHPMTKDEFLKYAKALTKDGQYGFCFKQTANHALWDFWSFFRQAGGQLYNTDFTKVFPDAKPAEDALTFLQSLRKTEDVSPPQNLNWQTAYSWFLQGKCAMLYHGSWLIPALKQSGVAYGTAMVPRIFDNAPYTVWADEHMFAFTGSNAERTKAAVEFVKWVLTKDNSVKWGLGSGNVPSLLAARAAYAQDATLKPIEEDAAQTGDRLFMAPYDVVGPTLATKVLQPILESIYGGGTSINAGVEAIQKQGDQLLAQQH